MYTEFARQRANGARAESTRRYRSERETIQNKQNRTRNRDTAMERAPYNGARGTKARKFGHGRKEYEREIPGSAGARARHANMYTHIMALAEIREGRPVSAESDTTHALTALS